MTRTDIVNKLLALFDRPWYLEIGTAGGEHFDQVQAHFKVGVDPGEYARCVSYRGTSDDFFKQIDFGPFKFHVVFVDGLHHAEQAWRDVRNAAYRLRPGGYIVMHDCLPPTWLHAGREPYVEGGAWNGDVFKAAVQATQYFDAVTVDTDEGCTVLQVRKGVRLPQELEVELDFEEFDERREELLNIVDPEEWVKQFEGEPVV